MIAGGAAVCGIGSPATTAEPIVWVDGQLLPRSQATVPIDSLAVALAGSLFEAVRTYWHEEFGRLAVFRLSDHLERLEQSLKITRGVLRDDARELRSAVHAVARANCWGRDGYVRITVFCAERHPASVVDPDTIRYSAAVSARPSPMPLPPGNPIQCRVSSWRRIDPAATPTRVKAAANYHNTRLAGFEARVDGYDSAILLNAAGTVAEAADASLFIVRGETLVTPPVTAGGLESITRDTVLKLAAQAGIAIAVREIDRAELYIADEVFLTNTAALIRPVGGIDRVEIADGAVGPMTRQLAQQFARAARRESNTELSEVIDACG
jgi:branched-chain amino acid aminotransferase